MYNDEIIGKLLVKINIHEHILPIFLIFINILAKTIEHKEY